MGFRVKRSWPTYVNEKLYLSNIQLDCLHLEVAGEGRVPLIKSHQEAAILFLGLAWNGFVKELAQNSGLEASIESLEELVRKMETPSPEVRRIREEMAQPNSILMQFAAMHAELKIAQAIEEPAKMTSASMEDVHPKDSIICKLSVVDRDAEDTLELLVNTKKYVEKLIKELRESALEW